MQPYRHGQVIKDDIVKNLYTIDGLGQILLLTEPHYRSHGLGRKSMYGYFTAGWTDIIKLDLLQVLVFLEVACLDLEAFAEKR